MSLRINEPATPEERVELRARLLAEAATKTIRRVVHFDVFLRAEADSFTQPDADGDAIWVVTSDELKNCEAIRVLIPVGTTREDAARALRKVLEQVEAGADLGGRTTRGDGVVDYPPRDVEASAALYKAALSLSKDQPLYDGSFDFEEAEVERNTIIPFRTVCTICGQSATVSVTPHGGPERHYCAVHEPPLKF